MGNLHQSIVPASNTNPYDNGVSGPRIARNNTIITTNTSNPYFPTLTSNPSQALEIPEK